MNRSNYAQDWTNINLDVSKALALDLVNRTGLRANEMIYRELDITYVQVVQQVRNLILAQL